jgi:hypothetical protein
VIQDIKVQAAVSRIIQRSERQEDAEKLVGTYVDIGLLPQLKNSNHQIFYGRRGTGKTHVMKVLASSMASDAALTIVYLDCRTLGSTSQFSDTTLPMGRRCLALFRDFLLALYQGLLEHIVESPSSRATEALAAADELAAVVTEPLSTLKAARVATAEAGTRKTTVSAGARLGPSIGALSSLSAEASTTREKTDSQTTEFSVENEDKIIFPELLKSLRLVLDLAETKIFVLVDEWSSLPQDVQPYLAEFIKRGVLPIQRAVVKISALEYRCRFLERIATGLLGFELGADIATAPDLDDYFVYDRNPDQITDVYADVLFRHLSSELEPNYLRTAHGVSSGQQLASRLFTERRTCGELARACEGVIRDLINIFTKAFFDSHRRGRPSIDKQAVLASARQWFEQDKAQYLDNELQNVLRAIVDDVIGTRRARSFLLPRHLEKHPTVQRLFDARVIHHMQRGYADKDNPGVRYNIYTIDYGAYVDLIGTSKEPDLELIERGDGEVVVPFDDKRSIRRIVLSEDILER